MDRIDLRVTQGGAHAGLIDRVAIVKQLEDPKRGGDEIETREDDHQAEGHGQNDRLVIAIDGPAAAGKTTVANELSRRIGALFFDTGVIYRALALAAIEQDVDPTDVDRLTEIAHNLPVRVARPTIDDGRVCDVRVDGRDITWAIRSPEVDRIVSAVSAHPTVREALLQLQRRIGRSGRVVMVGRDIGTVVMPDADLKIWLDASLDERARRRSLDLQRMGKPQALDDVRADMAARDQIDADRDVAPMKPASDALMIVTDGLTIDQVVDRVVALLSARTGNGERR